MKRVLTTAVGTAAKAIGRAAQSQGRHMLQEGSQPLRAAAERHAEHRAGEVASRLRGHGPFATAQTANEAAFPPLFGHVAAPLRNPFPTFCKCKTRPAHLLDNDPTHVITKCEECAKPSTTATLYKFVLEGAQDVIAAAPPPFAAAAAAAPPPPRGRSHTRRNRVATHSRPATRSRGRSRTRTNRAHHRSRSPSRTRGSGPKSSGSKSSGSRA
jgi:hypothetical protein